VVVALVAGATGCGLDLRGLAAAGSGDASTMTDAPVVVTADGGGGSSGGAGGEGGNEGGGSDDGGGTGDASAPTADASSCVGSLSPAWSLVAFEASRAPCPGGYNPRDAIAGAVAGAGACGCDCTVTSQPSCTQGTLGTQWSSTGASAGPCPNPGASMTVGGSGCTNTPAGPLAQGFSASALPASGGSCAASVSPADPSKVVKIGVRTCDVPPSAADAVCSGAPPPGFAACVAATGDVPCPAGPFATRTLIEDDVVLVCPGCGPCNVVGTCGNAQVKFYSDAQCGNVVAQLPCTGTCVDTGGGNGKQVAAFEYTAQVQASCQASPSGAPAFDPVKPRTICCR
jgi:hypothetical protein